MMKMFSDAEDYEEVESTGYESYGEQGYSHPLAHYNDEDEGREKAVGFFRDQRQLMEGVGVMELIKEILEFIAVAFVYFFALIP